MKFSFRAYLLKITVLAVTYWGTAQLGLLFSSIENDGGGLWPPAGIALVALLIFGHHLWPGVVLGAFLTHVSTGAAVTFALVIAISSTLEALAGVYLLRHVDFDQMLSRRRDVVSLIFWGAIISPLLGATIGVTGLGLIGLVPWPAYLSVWWTWWLGHALGVLVIAPLGLIWTGRHNSLDRGIFSQGLTNGADGQGRPIPPAGIIASAMDAIITVNETQRIILFNAAAEEVFGCSAAKAIGQSLDRFIPTRFRDAHTHHIQRFGQSGLTNQKMGRLTPLWGLRSNGQEFPIEASISQMEIAGQKLYTTILRDVTDKLQTQQDLLSSEARYRAIVQDQTELICRSTPDQVLTFVNNAYARYFGRLPEELIGQSFLDLIAPENRQFIRTNHANLSPENPMVSNELEEMRADGSRRWLHWTDRGIFDQTGQLVEVQAVGRDITEQKQAQQQIEFQKTLLECELEASPDGILIVSGEREWLYANQRFVDMWGLLPEIVAARSSPVTLAYIRSLLVEPEVVIAGIEYLLEHPAETNRVEIRLKDGRVFDRYSAPIVSAANEYYGRLWIFRDITRERQLEAQLLQSQKMEAIGQLAGGIAHDFNNILVPIIGYVELGMMQLSPNDKLYSDLQRVREAAERAVSLTQQILAFSRKQMLEMRVLDLNGLASEFQQLIQRLIGEDIELQTFLEPALYQVKADKGQIEQVLLNLVVNARDAMPTGGKLSLETANAYLDEAYLKKYTGPQTPGHYAMLAVSDTGNGMDPAIQQQIFEPFFTTKAQGRGTGLGLATVFGIIKQHGGYIWVYSELYKGTTFKIYLPKANETMQTPPTTHPIAGSDYGSETILVVEDEEMVRHLVCETLASHGYKVIEALGPADGLRLAAEQKDIIHLLLTDVIMPNMNGRELYEKMTAFKPDIKVLYMSGYTDNVIVHHGILDEGINFLQKPFTVRMLTRKVKQVLS
ncbi:MAG: PAS domain S-box protein [Anaerolineae bacterium]|nr:PAS domain S-box protein [Anaerolineae bacterium]